MEIRYNTVTKEVTGWWSNRAGNHEVKLKNRPEEAIVDLDISIPDKSLPAWLCDGKGLIPNPDYVEPQPPRDLKAEIEELQTKVSALEKEVTLS